MDDAPEPPIGFVRSLEFYFDDGNIVFEVCTHSSALLTCISSSHVHLQVSGILYRLHKSILASRLDLFGGMFLLPKWKSQHPPGDGLDDSHPIRIESGVAVRRDFEALLKHIYGG